MGAALGKIAEQFGKSCTLTLSQADGAVNLVWTSLTKDTVADFLKTDVGNCGRSLSTSLAAADMIRLTEEETELPEGFVSLMKGDRNKGVVLIEGRSPDGDSSTSSVAPIVLRVYEKPYASDSTPLCEFRLPLRLSSVEEIFKGVSVWKAINGLQIENVNIACEGGWGINPYFAIRPDYYLPLKGFIGVRFRDYSDSVIRPLFTPFTDSSLHRVGSDRRVDDVLRARMLGDAIPAESFATGANALEVASILNYDMAANRKNGNPRMIKTGWRHSDIKDVAFYHVYSIFEEFLKEGDQ